MKKLITGAIAAMALLFGFAACSGDLHENEVAPLYIEGVTSARVPMTKVSDTEQIYEFTYSKNLGGWHNTSASIEFKTMVDKDSWARDWGAPKDETVTLKVGDEEYTPLLNREADGVGGAGPGNIEVYDLVEGQKYTIRMKVDVATLKGEIRIEGLSIAAPDMEIIVSTDASGKDAVKIPMTRGGTTYTYEFIAAKTTDLYYYFYCSALNTTYNVVADGKDDTGKDKYTLTQVMAKLYDAHGNLLNVDGNVVTDDSYAPDGWSKANTLSILKDHKYSIEFVADETHRGFNGSIKYEVKVDDIEVTKEKDEDKYKVADGIFKNTVLIGQWKYTDSHNGDYAVELTNGSYTFTAAGSSVKFKVLRDKSEDAMAWGGKISIKPGTNYEPGEAKTLTYKTTLVLDKENGFAYAPKEEKSALKEVDYITAEGLKVGTKYTISIEPERLPKDESEKLSKAKCDEILDKLYKADIGTFKICLTEVDTSKALSVQVAEFSIRGSMTSGWDPTTKIEDESTATKFVFGPFTKDNPEFKFAASDWSDEYSYGETITIKNEKDATATITLKGKKDNPANTKVNGIPEGAEYKIIIDVDDVKNEINCTIKIIKAGVEDKRSSIEKFAEDTYIKGTIVFGNEKNKVKVANKTLATDKKSATIKYGPFPKSYAVNNDWILTDDTVFYGSCKLRYVDMNNEQGTNVKLVAATNDNEKNTITDATFNKEFYYIVVTVETDGEENISKVFAKIEPTEDEVKYEYDEGKFLYLVGEEPIGWSKNEKYVMKQNDKVYTIEVDSLPSKWKIWDGTWDYNFGKGEDTPTADGNVVDVWFGGGDIDMPSDTKVKITLTVEEGSDKKGSSIPSKIKIEKLD